MSRSVASAVDVASDPALLPRRYRRGLLISLLAVMLLTLMAAVGLGYRLADPNYPANDSVEAGFARDMQVHHAQAVEMALIVRDKTADPILRAVAYDLTTSQQQQIGQMFAWLRLWGLPPSSSAKPMAWTHAGRGASTSRDMTDMKLLPDGRMPGMATPGQLARLRAATGVTAERLFIELMLAHHRAGIAMAQAAQRASDRPEVSHLATTIINAQRAEITQLQQLQRERQS